THLPVSVIVSLISNILTEAVFDFISIVKHFWRRNKRLETYSIYNISDMSEAIYDYLLLQHKLLFICENLPLTSTASDFMLRHTIVIQPVLCMEYIMRATDCISI